MRFVMGFEPGDDQPGTPAPGPAGRPGPRVLHVVPTALGRGAQLFARALADELGGPPAGHSLVSLFDGPEAVAVEHRLEMPGGVAAARGLHPRAVAALAGLVRQEAPDVVVAHGGDAYKYAALASRRPVVYCAIGTWPATAGRLRRGLWRALVRRARVTAAVSDDVAVDCRRVLGVADARLVVVPNGRDPVRFCPPTAGRPGSGDPVRLLFVGYLDAGKGPDRFIDLVSGLRRLGLPVTGRVVGDGPLRAALEGPAAAAGVELVGPSAHVVPHLQRSDVFVFPSTPDGEGMPGVLIEAGLCGLPAVATGVAGVSTVVEHGVTGLVVPVGDPEALAQAVGQLVTRPDRRRAMGQAARARCAGRFALAEVAARWDELVRRVADPGSRASDLPPVRSTPMGH